MGEAKRRKSITEKMLLKQPRCIFCGGSTPADTRDHVPPIAIFDGRQRPAGLEFSACSNCNSGSRNADEVASLLSRMFPDPVTPEQDKEMRRRFASVHRNNPGLLAELDPSLQQRRRFRAARSRLPMQVHALNASGPLLNKEINIFAAKIGLALHYHLTNRIVPRLGGVAVRWFSNFEAATGNIPADFVAKLGTPKTLRQGRFEVSEQFMYSSLATEDGKMSAHWAGFRQSFAIAAFVSDDISNLGTAPEGNVFPPGFWHGST